MEAQNPSEKQPAEPSSWAAPVDRLKAPTTPSGAVNLNVTGRALSGPLQGFGPLWQKDYRIRLSNAPVNPQEVIKVWKEKFPEFWPKGIKFYGSTETIQPGEVAVLNMGVPNGPSIVSTGILVIYSDDTSFSFMTPQGHMFSAFITFSAYEDQGASVANVRVLLRAADPIYEISLRLGAGKIEDGFWKATLRNLARYFGVEGEPRMLVECLDNRLQWREAKNVWHNAGVRTVLYHLGAPLRWTRRLVSRGD